MPDFTPALSYPIGLAGLALALPLILLYLLKPKPKYLKFPTTMFIKDTEKSRRLRSLFRYFTRDPLLFVQLFMILILSLAAAGPYISSMQPSNQEESVALVIDASASMQATDVAPNRFAAAVSKARDIVGGLNEESTVSIILAENIPATALRDSDKTAAFRVLDSLAPADTSTNIGDSMMLARDILSGSDKKKRMIVLSDLASSEGMRPQVVRKIANLEDIGVSVIRFAKDSENTGIIGFSASRAIKESNQLLVAYTVRNYGKEDRTLKTRVIIDDNEAASETKKIKAGGDEFFFFDVKVNEKEHLIKATLDTDDALEVDDTVYSVVARISSNNVLLISDTDRDKFLKYALASLPYTDMRVAIPPVMPPTRGFNTVILGDIKRDNILPGTFREISDHVNAGGSLIILASRDLSVIENQYLKDLLPVNIGELTHGEESLTKVMNHDIIDDVSLRNVVVNVYYKASKKDDADEIVRVREFPAIATKSYGKGKVLYLGINPDSGWSNFYYSTSYPIMLSQILEFINRRQDSLTVHNQNVGEYLTLPKRLNVTLPAGLRIEKKSFFLDKAGVYEVDYLDHKEYVTVNLISDRESNITSIINEGEADDENTLEPELVTSKRNLYPILLALIVFMLFFEIFIYRRRGLL